ncbi:hypothetical protein [Streptomyces sp. NPDC094049]
MGTWDTGPRGGQRPRGRRIAVASTAGAMITSVVVTTDVPLSGRGREVRR